MQSQIKLPVWILIVSGLIALMEIMVSLSICFSPEPVLESVDMTAKGVDFLVYMWGTRQFAVGVIFGFATLKRSAPMLTVCYVFLMVMFAGDLVAGLTLEEQSLVIGGAVMGMVSAAMIFALNRKS